MAGEVTGVASGVTTGGVENAQGAIAAAAAAAAVTQSGDAKPASTADSATRGSNQVGSTIQQQTANTGMFKTTPPMPLNYNTYAGAEAFPPGAQSEDQRVNKMAGILKLSENNAPSYAGAAARVRDEIMPSGYRQSFDKVYAQKLKESNGNPLPALGKTMKFFDGFVGLGNESLLDEFNKADGKYTSGQSKIPKNKDSPGGRYFDNPEDMPGLTTTDEPGRYHNVVNERNKQLAALKDAKANNASDDDVNKIIQRAKTADEQATKLFAGMNSNDQRAVRDEDKAIGLKTTPAVDPQNGATIDDEIGKIEPKYAEATAASRKAATDATQAGEKAAADAFKSGSSVEAATSAASKAVSGALKAAGPVGLALGTAVGAAVDIKNLVDAVHSGDHAAVGDAATTFAANLATFGMYSVAQSVMGPMMNSISHFSPENQERVFDTWAMGAGA